jgi:Tol biopolymer transport system component
VTTCAWSASAAPAGQIAFNSTRSGKYQVWVINADGSALRRLTASDQHELYPAISPDGAQVAYVGFGVNQLRSCNLRTGQDILLYQASDHLEDSQLCWSPEGSKLLFAEGYYHPHLKALDLATGTITDYTAVNPSFGNEYWVGPMWVPRPEGDCLYFCARHGWWNSYTADIARLNLNTLAVEWVFPNEPTGDINYSTRNPGGYNPIANRLVLGWGSDVSTVDPDGTTIVFGRYEAANNQWSLYFVSAQGGPIVPFDAANGPGQSCYPSWGPPLNRAPMAVASAANAVAEGGLCTLDGSASSDPDNDSLLFAWQQIDGPPVSLADPDTATPSFVAPWVAAEGADLTFALTVDDQRGCTDTGTVTMHVENVGDPPTCASARPSVAELWPPNHKLVAVSVLNVGTGNLPTTVTISRVMQDEPSAGSGDGDMPGDAVLGPDGRALLLRAERAGNGNGRVYHVCFTASNAQGRCSGEVTVCVPHDQKPGRVCVDDGPLYPSCP